MMQKTDFEFELVIGEDCSTDKTREICFEYQKRYPDKIRVLWCDHNLYRNPHPAGGNGERNMAHCRGEFVALCEGDDYWIDPLKLQKQVDVMREYPSVGLCFCGADAHNVVTRETRHWFPYNNGSTLMSGEDYMRTRFGMTRNPQLRPFVDDQLRTLTTLIRGSCLKKVSETIDVLKWGLCVGDYSLWASLALVSDVYFLNENVGVYRIHPGGITSYGLKGVRRDCDVIRAYFMRHHFHADSASAYSMPLEFIFQESVSRGSVWQHSIATRIILDSDLRHALHTKRYKLTVLLMYFGLYLEPTVKLLDYFQSLYGRIRNA